MVRWTSGHLDARPNRRTRRLSLTAAGRALYARVVPAQEALIAARFGVLPDDELRVLARGLRRLRRGGEPGIE